jgi:hypothetical protein
VLALADPGDALALWKFVHESDALHEATRVICFSTLDLYAVYRDNERSLRSFHEATMVTVSPGEGAATRCDAKAGLDRHAAYYVDGTVREVEHDDAEPWDTRVFRVSDIREPRLIRHVGGASLDLWVRGPEQQTGPGFSHLIDSVAYWLAELSEQIAPELSTLAGSAPCFRVDVDVDDPEFWFGQAEPPGDDELGLYRLVRHGVQIALGPLIRRLLPTAENTGERLLVGMLLDVFDDVLRDRGHEGISDERKAEIGNRVAPEGVKKHLLMIPGLGNELMAHASGPARLVKQADLTEARRLLGRTLMEEFRSARRQPHPVGQASQGRPPRRGVPPRGRPGRDRDLRPGRSAGGARGSQRADHR